MRPGQPITELAAGPDASIVFTQAENRLHAIKAVPVAAFG